MNQTLANVTAFVRTEINELGSSAHGFQHLGIVSLAASGGGREALTKLMLGKPVPFPWSRNSEPEQRWRVFYCAQLGSTGDQLAGKLHSYQHCTGCQTC